MLEYLRYRNCKRSSSNSNNNNASPICNYLPIINYTSDRFAWPSVRVRPSPLRCINYYAVLTDVSDLLSLLPSPFCPGSTTTTTTLGKRPLASARVKESPAVKGQPPSSPARGPRRGGPAGRRKAAAAAAATEVEPAAVSSDTGHENEAEAKKEAGGGGQLSPHSRAPTAKTGKSSRGRRAPHSPRRPEKHVDWEAGETPKVRPPHPQPGRRKAASGHEHPPPADGSHVNQETQTSNTKSIATATEASDFERAEVREKSRDMKRKLEQQREELTALDGFLRGEDLLHTRQHGATSVKKAVSGGGAAAKEPLTLPLDASKALDDPGDGDGDGDGVDDSPRQPVTTTDLFDKLLATIDAEEEAAKKRRRARRKKEEEAVTNREIGKTAVDFDNALKKQSAMGGTRAKGTYVKLNAVIHSLI